MCYFFKVMWYFSSENTHWNRLDTTVENLVEKEWTPASSLKNFEIAGCYGASIHQHL